MVWSVGLPGGVAPSAGVPRLLLGQKRPGWPLRMAWRFSSVVSVGSHELDDPLTWFYNPSPPVEFFARGVDVEVAWLGGGRLRVTGNSFATPHMAGICALVRSKHPELTAFALKNVLFLTASNVAS